MNRCLYFVALIFTITINPAWSQAPGDKSYVSSIGEWSGVYFRISANGISCASRFIPAKRNGQGYDASRKKPRRAILSQ